MKSKCILIIVLSMFLAVGVAFGENLIIEAEDMEKEGTYDIAVPGGWALRANGENLSKEVVITSTMRSFGVTARGDIANLVWPKLEVRLGSVVVATKEIDSVDWKNFTFTGAGVPAPGTYVLTLTFVNDYYKVVEGEKEDRNVYVDKFVIYDSVFTCKSPVSLSWDANTEPDLAGYKIYHGTASGDYSDSIDVGNVTKYSLPLDDGVTHYVAATAYDEENNESDYSDELTLHVVGGEDTTPPAAPKNLRSEVEK